MDMPRFTSAALDVPSDTAPSSRQTRRSPQDSGPVADWWARHTGGAPNDVSVLDTDEEELVTDTVAAFRAARQAGSVSDPHVREGGRDTPAAEDSLDYFAPAFRRVLGEDERAKDVQAQEGLERDEQKKDVPGTSLDYFAPAFQRVLREDGGSAAASGAAEDISETDEVTSLDYFAPAFRRVLDDQARPTTEMNNRGFSSDAQTTVLRFKEAMKDMSHRARLKRPMFFGVDRM